MASAAKRRKAARKKKKELESQIASNLPENGDLISENEKDSDGGVQNNSPTSEDHPRSFDEDKEDLNGGESLSPPFASMNKPLESNAVVQIVEEVEAGDNSQIEWRDVEEAVGDETDGQGSELKSSGVLTIKVVKKEETQGELESAGISLERLESTKESCNGESESLHMASSAEKPPECPMTPRAARRTSWMNCCGLLEVITGSRT
ncbi:uncharacterized protein LOC115757311 isoform X2 [Rhodamnia argentea]|uniref:Uncharacterized protein LOC115757311 isoform X2 n=1 Tax=Rhodamnia argentea TaxID=178133 RepID=A0A8B8R1L7_9MYRT|nr:uncharacterized protein LOC115757311 isoform X2 [Rhodamnia argentea]